MALQLSKSGGSQIVDVVYRTSTKLYVGLAGFLTLLAQVPGINDTVRRVFANHPVLMSVVLFAVSVGTLLHHPKEAMPVASTPANLQEAVANTEAKDGKEDKN